uniref:Uncharacterized protein n=1 Tax=Salix viminalis TaxID=40686 RepID=A0A6N2L1Z2_SALVM
MLACKVSDTEEKKTGGSTKLLQYTSICSALLASVSSSFPIRFLSEIIDSKQCQTLESVLASIENQENLQTSNVGPEKKLSSHNIWSRREAAEETLPRQGELLTKYTSDEVLEKEG